MSCTFKSLRLLFAALIMLVSFQADASHYAAVDISVQYAGTGPNDLRYKVILDVYFACEQFSAGPSTSERIYMFSAKEGGTINNPYDQNTNRWQDANQVCVNDVGNEQIIHQLCDAGANSCSSPTSGFPGYKHHRYETIFTTTSRQTDWIFWWRSNARNSGIKNIVTAISAGGPNPTPSGWIFIEAGIDNDFRYDISTPKFAVHPLPYLCDNQPVTYLNGPLDSDGDSLEVLNVIPKEHYNVDYLYRTLPAPGYSAADPIGSNPNNPYKVDGLTGTATFTPTQSGNYVLAFRCNKYDRGTGSACKGNVAKTGRLIAFINRDVQVSVLGNCSGNPPVLSEVTNVENGTSTIQDKYTMCSGSTFKFNITASSTLAGRALYIEGNTKSIPGSVINTTGAGTSNVTGTFEWTPHYGNIGEHILIITAKDSTCGGGSPVVLKSYKVLRLEVIPSIDAGADKPVCLAGGRPVQLHVKGADECIKWTDIAGGAAIGLSNGQDTVQSPVVDSPYKVATYVVYAYGVPPVCKNRDTVSLYQDTAVSVSVFPENPIILCRPDYLQLDAQLKGLPPVDSLVCGISTDTATARDSLFINGSLAGAYDTLGPSTSTFPNNVTGARQQYLIKRADLLESGLLYSTIKAISFVAKSPAPSYEYKNFRIYIKCTNEDKLSAISGFQTGLNLVYLAPGPIAIVDGINKFALDKFYNWNVSQNLLIEIAYDNNATAAPDGNNPIITFVPTDYVSTIMETDAPGSICVSTGITENFARPQFMFHYVEPRRPLELVWTPGTFLTDSSNNQPLAYIPRSTKYIVSTIGRNNCIIKDSADIYVPVHDYQILPVDSNICFGETAPMRVAKGGFTYKWYKINDKGQYEILSNTKESTCWDCGNPVLSPEKTTTYKVAVYDSVWCIDTLTHVITVMPLPDIRILNKDTVVKYGQSIQLLASGARMYNWTPVASLNNANVSYPVATPTEPTEFIAAGIGTNGCIARDTLKVAIDYRDNLFIPSGFSPNGDGKNDVFKVSNLTFQRIVEFRVFNRWGQEIFNANDNSGWDGAWKGEPQDMDTYTYQIRIGFPDGYIESYKGVVTVIR